MDPDDDYRRGFDVNFCMLAIFLMAATFSVAFMARKDTAGSREQDGNAN